MNVPSTLALALTATLALPAANLKTATPQTTVKVCLTFSRDAWIVAQAEAAAAQMFSGIGVRLAWYHGTRHCKSPAGDFLPVILSTGTSDDEYPGALAYSHLHGTAHVEIFYDRILTTVEPRRICDLLAHVLAHEITHTLEDLNRHSDAGLMKAHWSQQDIEEMSFRPLPFGPEDVELIRRALVNRSLVALSGN
ncbi:MAG TPA: hypothetical protein VGN17_14250 [Bryobacteraceae bacterium]|jgi:hypothetical protein